MELCRARSCGTAELGAVAGGLQSQELGGVLELTGCVSVAAGLAGTCHWPHYRSRGSPATGGPGTHQSVSAGAQATTP